MGRLGRPSDMLGFAFTTVWTSLVLVLFLIGVYSGADAIFSSILIAMVLFGAVFMRITWREWRRRESLRTKVEDGYVVYIWTEDGREVRSRIDPRPGWDHPDTYV
jgi:hypothetical protein